MEEFYINIYTFGTFSLLDAEAIQEHMEIRKLYGAAKNHIRYSNNNRYTYRWRDADDQNSLKADGVRIYAYADFLLYNRSIAPVSVDHGDQVLLPVCVIAAY